MKNLDAQILSPVDQNILKKKGGYNDTTRLKTTTRELFFKLENQY